MTDQPEKVTPSQALGMPSRRLTPELLEALADSSSVAACCSAGCQVEPDGYCQHGHPSVLIELGVI